MPGIVHAAEGDAERGAKLFKQCALCHVVEDGRKSGIGPNLAGVIGRKAGTTQYPYSAAMKSANFRWDEKHLNAFLKSPAATVKGNRMTFPGLDNPQDRADVIAYLETKSDSGGAERR